MNCEKCQELVGELVDGELSREDGSTLSLHLEECLACAEVHDDLQSIVAFAGIIAENTARYPMRILFGFAFAT